MGLPERGAADRQQAGGRRRLVWSIFGRIAALLVGLIWGFFVAFNVVFSDIFGFEARLFALGFVFAAYALMAMIFGFLGPRTGMRWMWWLCPPGLIAVTFSLLDDAGRIAYTLSVMGALVAGAAAGAWLGSLAGRYFAQGYRRS